MTVSSIMTNNLRKVMVLLSSIMQSILIRSQVLNLQGRWIEETGVNLST